MRSDCTNCGQSARYDPSKSSTHVELGEPLKISYGHGKVQGVLGRDTAIIAGLSVQNVTLGEVTDEAVQPVQYPESVRKYSSSIFDVHFEKKKAKQLFFCFCSFPIVFAK